MPEGKTLQHWIVLLEATEFADAAIAPIDALGDDMATLHKQIIASGVSEDQIQYFRGHENATKAKFDACMGHIGSRAKEGDLVVLAFAGYGIHLHGADYLVPGDADVAAIRRAIEGGGAPESLIPVKNILESLDLGPGVRKLVLMDMHSIEPERLIGETPDEEAGGIPFGSEKQAIPKNLAVLTSRSLAQMPSFAFMRAENNSTDAPRLTVFMRIVLEAFTGYADQPLAGVSKAVAQGDGRVRISEFLRHVENRSTSRGYPLPNIQHNLVDDFELLPFIEVPVDLTELSVALVREVQENLYVAALKLLFVHHDAEAAAIAFANCAGMEADESLQDKARHLRYTAFAAAGDAVRAWSESQLNREPLRVFVWENTRVYAEKTGNTPTELTLGVGYLLEIDDFFLDDSNNCRLHFAHALKLNTKISNTREGDAYAFTEEEVAVDGASIGGWVDDASLDMVHIRRDHNRRMQEEGRAHAQAFPAGTPPTGRSRSVGAAAAAGAAAGRSTTTRQPTSRPAGSPAKQLLKAYGRGFLP
ncbi:MAG: hypothetical protein HQ581_17420 [Planctomycetes bacterium]|nr:hypothetical protein [Planctomycetota bacterium]